MNSKINSYWNTLLIVAIADILQVVVRLAPFSMWNMIVGIVLICLLSSYKINPDATMQELVILSTVWGLTILLTIGFLLQNLANSDSQDKFFFFVWGMISIATYMGITLSQRKNPPKPVTEPRPVADVESSNVSAPSVAEP